MNPKIKHSRDRAFKRFVYIFFFLMCACFVLPLIVVISASFTSEQALTSGGFSLLPRDFTLDAYKSAFSSGTRVLRAYGVTIFQAVVGTVLSSLVAALAAYPLSRSNFRFRRPITVFIFFTMLFGAGMIPNYIIFAKYYKLADSIWIYILPGITGGAWNTMVFRTFFKGLPETLFEAAYLDGASELRIFFSVVLPLSTPVFASLGFMALVARWNDYTTSMIYIRNESRSSFLSSILIDNKKGGSGYEEDRIRAAAFGPAERLHIGSHAENAGGLRQGCAVDCRTGKHAGGFCSPVHMVV